MNEKETSKDIIADMRTKAECAKPYDDGIVMMLTDYADRLDEAHKREVDALKQRLAELDAEVAAKDEVIKRLNDAISEEQRRKMATTEKSSAVGDAAKLREAVIKTQSVIAKCMDILNKIPECGYNVLVDDVADELCGLLKEHIKAALAAPPRNCDVGTAVEQAERYGRHCDKFTSDGMHCESCPCCGKIPFGKCEFAWLQMPYVEQEGGAK